MAELALLWAENAYGPPEGRWAELAHWTHPVQQRVRSRTHLFQLAFAREAVARLGESFSDCVFEPHSDGLRVLGRHEAALRAPIARIAELYDRRIDVDAPAVRLCPGTPACEPVMTMLVRVPRHLSRAVSRDLADRGARAAWVELERAHVVVHAQARLAVLLGYPDEVERITGGMAEVCMRLSHYEPVVRAPDPQAA